MDSFFEDYIEFKNVVSNARIEINTIKNPFKKFKLKREIDKKVKAYVDKIYQYIYMKELDIDFIYNFMQFSGSIESIDIEYKSKLDVFNHLDEVTAIYKQDKNPVLVILLYYKRDEIRFAKYADGEIIQYPRHVFIKSVIKQNAVYEYDESMINYIKGFMFETIINDLGGI